MRRFATVVFVLTVGVLPTATAEEMTAERIREIAASADESKPEGELAAYPIFTGDRRARRAICERQDYP